MSEDVSRAVLESEVARLQKENDDLRAQLTRPVNVTVSGPDAKALEKILQYLPQLTHISTNLSHVATALQRNEGHVADIADRLAEAQIVKMPQDRQPKQQRPKSKGGNSSWSLP